MAQERGKDGKPRWGTTCQILPRSPAGTFSNRLIIVYLEVPKLKAKLSKPVVFFALSGLLLAVMLAGCSLLPTENKNDHLPAPATINPVGKVIVDENAHPGTDSWNIPPDEETTIEIQAYAGATSVLPGQTLTFYVSTLQEGTNYRIEIYRLGWYQGHGGRLMTTVANLVGFAQGYYDRLRHRLVGCRSCHVDTGTGLVEAGWLPSYKLSVPLDWTTGVYLAKFIDAHGLQTYVPFDVRSNAHSLFVAVTSDTTYAAYNDWGGYSLYTGINRLSNGTTETTSANKGVKVSFNRPYAQNYGSGFVLEFEADAIHWLERQGYDLSYMSSVDFHEDPAQLLQHRVYLSLGHDEYWTKEMRDGVEHARDLGVSLAFLGANAAGWQMRFEPGRAGIPDRTIVCYKVLSGAYDLARDPLYGEDDTRVTSQWRDPVINRPENALIGIMYSSLTNPQKQRPGFPWELNPLAKSQLLDGTGLQAGKQYGCDLVGYEWDRIFNNGRTPSGLQVLGISHTISAYNKPDTSNTTYYIAQSGAMVFATGSIYWTASLDAYRLHTDKMCAGQNSVIPGMQKLMANVMAALLNHQ
jgi:hypothetical protein